MFRHWTSESSSSSKPAAPPVLTPYFSNLPIETSDERYVRLWQEFITAFMKVCDIHEMTHITDDHYRSFTLAGGGDFICHIVPSSSLRKRLERQKGKAKQIKTGIHRIVGPYQPAIPQYTGLSKQMAYMVD